MSDILCSWFIFVLLSSIPVIYWYFTRNYNYWSKRGIKGPRPKPGVGNLLDQFIIPKPYLEMDWFKRYGKIYGVYNGTKPTLTVNEPELIKNLLVKDFHIFSDRYSKQRTHPILSKHLVANTGDDWKRLRSIVSPTFTSAKMKKMYPMIKDCLKEFIGSLDELAMDGKDINVKDLFGNYTMDVIATCAFATKTNAHKDSNNPFIKSAVDVFNPKFYRIIPFLIFPKFLSKMLNIYSGAKESSNKFFFDLTRKIIKERKPNHKKHNDFIQLLLNAQKSDEKEVKEENDINESHHLNEGQEELDVEKQFLSTVTDKYITEDEILAQSWIFFVAGYETTATTLTFASYELALNPDIQQRLYEELMTAVDANGDIDYECLSRLPFLDSVISETLRLYAPVVRTFRLAKQDYDLGTTGIKLYKGQRVEISIYALHHSEEFYKQPFRFNPDRFMPENRHKIIPYTYLPFGAGPRSCIGMRFALMGAKICLAQIIRNFKLFRTEQTDVPLILKHNPVIHSPKRVIIGIEKR